jgi:hypothetical protein
MPWYWTDDLARTLIEAGKVEPSRVVLWLSAPVAVRSGEDDAQALAHSLLDEEEGEPPALPFAA